MYKYFLLFFILSGKISTAQVTYDTVQAHFAINESALDETDKQLLSLLVSKGVITPATNLVVIGYADYLGSENKNLELSENRARNVADYLVGLGINKDLIKLCTGKGSVKREEKDKKGFPADRRVDIVIETTKVETAKVAPAPPVNTVPTLPPDPFPKTPLGSSFILENILFYPNRHEIEDESLPILDRLVEDMKTHPNVHIRIEGHICCIHNGKSMAAVSYKDAIIDATDLGIDENAPYDENEPIKQRYRRNTLSRNRAKYIYEYLVKKGISADRMSFIGYGNLRPLVKDERTAEDEAKNRRVEIRITER